MKFPRSLMIVLAALSLAAFLPSCASLKFAMMKDDQLLVAGIDAWNTDKKTAAQTYWNKMKDPALKAQWLGYFGQYDALEALFDVAAASAPGTPEANLLASWNNSIVALEAFPQDLSIPDTFKPRLVPVARLVVRVRLDAEKMASAKEFMTTASDYLGTLIEWSAELQEIADYDRIQATTVAYRALDKSLEKSTANLLVVARAKPDFDDKIAAFESAIVAFTKAETTLAAAAKTNGYREGSALATLGDKYRTKRASARIEMEKALRDRAYNFKERIGEEFARQPEGDPSTMTLEDTLRFYEQTQRNVEAMQAEVVAFAAKYPKVIDRDMLKDVEAQKVDLGTRIVLVTGDIKKAQADAKVRAEYESRGKPVFPLVIGLFNPQPGSKGTDQKSRPAKFKGTLAGDAVYWWGNVEIAKNTLNDLVISVNDSRQVKVFNDNTLSGKRIEEKKAKDLVNRQYKVGNSWPVINAGAQLSGGRFFFEVGKGKDAKYNGDVVVYSSFIVRMR